MYRYYSTQRPITPGSYPKQNGKEIIENYEARRYIVVIGRFAWGHIEYEYPLTEKQASDYELIPKVEN